MVYIEFFYPKIHEAHSKIPGRFSLSEQIFLHWAAATLKGLGEFQNKKSRPLFIMIFESNMSILRQEILVPPIKRVLVGVLNFKSSNFMTHSTKLI